MNLEFATILQGSHFRKMTIKNLILDIVNNFYSWLIFSVLEVLLLSYEHPKIKKLGLTENVAFVVSGDNFN